MCYPPRDSSHSWQAAARRTSAGPLGAAFPAPTYAEQRGTTNFFAVPHSNGHRLRSPSISTFYTGFYTVLYRFIHFFGQAWTEHGQIQSKPTAQLPICAEASDFGCRFRRLHGSVRCVRGGRIRVGRVCSLTEDIRGSEGPKVSRCEIHMPHRTNMLHISTYITYATYMLHITCYNNML